MLIGRDAYPIRAADVDRFLHWVEVPPVFNLGSDGFYVLGPCWIWTGAVSYSVSTREPAEYGNFTTRHPGTKRRRWWKAHRFAYELMRGPIPELLTLDHRKTCESTLCVNPWHLEPVTNAVNVARANARRVARRIA